MSNPTLKFKHPLRPDQYAIAEHPAKVKFIAAGRRSGKSFLGGTVATLTANRGGQVCVLAPDYKRTKTIWDFVEKAVSPFKRDRLVSINKNDQIVKFLASGGEISFYSGENADSIRGNAYHFILGDELAFLKDDIYFDILLPCLADYDGSLMACSSPNGLNWFYTEWLRCSEDTSGRYAAWQFPTTANPLKNIQLYYEAMKLITPAAKFAQEYDAEFLGKGVLFVNVDECSIASEQTQAIPGHEYCFGIDTGRVNDATVIIVYDITLKAAVYMLRLLGTPFQAQENAIGELYNRFRPRTILIEKNNFGFQMSENLRRAGLPIQTFTTSLVSKNELIDKLLIAFQLGSLSIIPNKILQNELKVFAGSPLQSGLMSYGAPSGSMHDDSVIALALAHYAATAGTGRLIITAMPDELAFYRGAMEPDPQDIRRKARMRDFPGWHDDTIQN